MCCDFLQRTCFSMYMCFLHLHVFLLFACARALIIIRNKSVSIGPLTIRCSGPKKYIRKEKLNFTLTSIFNSGELGWRSPSSSRERTLRPTVMDVGGNHSGNGGGLPVNNRQRAMLPNKSRGEFTRNPRKDSEVTWARVCDLLSVNRKQTRPVVSAAVTHNVS